MVLSNKIKGILFSFFIMSCLLSDAQNYRLLNPSRTITFTKRDTSEADSAYFFMKIDSFSVAGTDTTFYFNRILDTIGDGSCEIINGDTVMIGNKAIAKDDINGTYVFFNKFGDSIFIRTKVDLEEEWHIYDWPDGNYIKGYIVNKLLLGILPGITDSVTRIQLNVYNSSGVIQPDIFPNQTKWDFTKNYGLIEYFNFQDFPEPLDKLPLILRGVANPDQNVVDVDAETAFNFQLGNEFHFREESVPDNESDADKRISAWKFYVMDTSETTTSATYQMERIRFDTLYYGATPSSTIIWDTIEVTYNYDDYGFLDTLELNLFQANKFGYSDWVKNDTIFKGIAHKYVYDWFNYDAGTNCLSNPDAISQPEQLYGDGLGLMHFLDSTGAANYYKFDMVYFQKGLLQWGTPYDFGDLDVAITGSNPERELKLFPNPARNVLQIQNVIANGNYELSIYSVDGKLIKQFELHSNDNGFELDIDDLSAGFYIINLNNSNFSYSGKFIKE